MNALIQATLLLVCIIPAHALDMDAPGVHLIELEHDGLQRRAIAYVPPGLEMTDAPMLLLFHGGGGNAAGTLDGTRILAEATSRGCIVVAPEGTPPDPDQAISFTDNPQSWNDGSGRTSLTAVARNVDDIGFVRVLLDECERRFAVDTARVYATGFSNGGTMSFFVGRALSHRIAAIAPIGCSDPTDIDPPPRRLPIMYVLGAADPYVPIDGGPVILGGKSYGTAEPTATLLDRWHALSGATADAIQLKDAPVLIMSHRNADEVEVMRHVIIEDHGHHWPGGVQELPLWFAGPLADTYDATPAIFDFLLDFSRQAQIRRLRIHCDAPGYSPQIIEQSSLPAPLDAVDGRVYSGLDGAVEYRVAFEPQGAG